MLVTGSIAIMCTVMGYNPKYSMHVFINTLWQTCDEGMSVINKIISTCIAHAIVMIQTESTPTGSGSAFSVLGIDRHKKMWSAISLLYIVSFVFINKYVSSGKYKNYNYIIVLFVKRKV